jgi:alpha-L-rhamnosidase
MLSQANWITSPKDAGTAARAFKKQIYPKAVVEKATLFATAMGNYAVHIDGERIGKGVLTPGFTSYKNRILYQEYDVTNYIKNGCVLELGLANGWAVGGIGYTNSNHFFADHASIIARLDITYDDGSVDTVVTDDSFDVYTTPVTFSEIYHGETVDLTAPIEYLGKAKLDDLKNSLVAQDGEWSTEHERLRPVEVLRTPKGETVIDFGQNLTGYVEVKIKGKRGDKIVINHAEVLDKEGNFYTANMRRARNEMTYVLSGECDVFKPTYTFQGFRYIRLNEYPLDTVDEGAFTPRQWALENRNLYNHGKQGGGEVTLIEE